MQAEKNIFSSFKSYDYYKHKPNNNKIQPKKKSLKPVIGAAFGVGLAYFATNKILPLKADEFTRELTIKEKTKKTALDVAQMLIMAGSANIGGVLAGSIGIKDKKKINKKWHEAGFQMMNTSIPMLMVSTTLIALEACKNTKSFKFLASKPSRIIGSIVAMATGAMCATKITNALKEDNAPKRKYTIKDSVANFDDIVATIKIGFNEITKYIPVDKILPFIYIYCGQRAGQKE